MKTKVTKSHRSAFKWRSILGLILMYMAMYNNWQWAWGLLFLAWVIPDLFSGVTYFMEAVTKKENPILYWIIIFTWFLMSAYSFAYLINPDWQYY